MNSSRTPLSSYAEFEVESGWRFEVESVMSPKSPPKYVQDANSELCCNLCEKYFDKDIDILDAPQTFKSMFEDFGQYWDWLLPAQQY